MALEEQGWISLGEIKGPKGDPGTGLTIKDFYSDEAELTANVSEPSVGDAYGVGADEKYDIYIYTSTKGWVNSGQITHDLDNYAPSYSVPESIEELKSTEKIPTAFGKIARAIKDLISHLDDSSVKHITSDEREAWNNKAPGGYGLGTNPHEPANTTKYEELFNKGTGFYQIDRAEDNPTDSPVRVPLLQMSRVMTSGAECGAQILVSDRYVGNPQIYCRVKHAGELGEWYQVVHSGIIGSQIFKPLYDAGVITKAQYDALTKAN